MVLALNVDVDGFPGFWKSGRREFGLNKGVEFECLICLTDELLNLNVVRVAPRLVVTLLSLLISLEGQRGDIGYIRLGLRSGSVLAWLWCWRWRMGFHGYPRR